MGHRQHEGEREVDEKASEENTDVGKSEECDGGHQVNLIIRENKITENHFDIKYLKSD